MEGTIKFVSPTKENRRKELYKVVTFKMDDGSGPRTYITKGMKNEARWKDLLVEGTRVGGLKLKKEGLIDADSPVFLINTDV